MQIHEAIDQAVSCIHDNEQSRKAIAGQLKQLLGADLGLYEEHLVYPVKPVLPYGRIGGVDSGFVEKSIHSIALVLIRAAGVIFEYRDGKVVDSVYYPGYYQFPVPHLTNYALDSDELTCSKSLLRLREEINAAKELIVQYKPEFLFLDGSIIPQYLDKPRKDSQVNELYHGLLRNFESLYELAEAHGVTLIATVESPTLSVAVPEIAGRFGVNDWSVGTPTVATGSWLSKVKLWLVDAVCALLARSVAEDVTTYTCE